MLAIFMVEKVNENKCFMIIETYLYTVSIHKYEYLYESFVTDGLEGVNAYESI